MLKKVLKNLKHRADPPLIIDFLCSMILNKKGFPIAKQTNWPCLKLKPNQKRSFKNLRKHLDEFLNHLINMQTNKRNLPKVYIGLQLAISIISCFLRYSFFFSKHWEDFSQHSHQNKAKNWHRLPRQRSIRCYPLEGQLWTNKSNRK